MLRSPPRHFRANLKEAKKPLRGTPCPTVTVKTSPGDKVGEPGCKSLPQHQRRLGKGPSFCEPHKMPGSCKECKVFLCFTPP